MGNYYEGTLQIPLKKDIPEDLKNALIGLTACQGDKLKPLKWENEECFLHERWDYPSFEFGFILKYEDNEDIELIEFDKSNPNLNNEDVYPKNMLNYLYGYYLRIDFCMNGYQQLGEKYVNWLKPFMDNSIIEYLGEIEDEDGHYKKQFFINENIFIEEMNSRKYICEGCDYFNKDYLCENFNLCKKSYDKGFKANNELIVAKAKALDKINKYYEDVPIFDDDGSDSKIFASKVCDILCEVEYLEKNKQ